MIDSTPSIAEIRKLSFRCRRGTKELEKLMRGYLDNHYKTASEQAQSVFMWLLNLEDDKLWDWIYLTGQQQTQTTSLDNRIYLAIEEYLQQPLSKQLVPLSGLEPESKA